MEMQSILSKITKHRENDINIFEIDVDIRKIKLQTINCGQIKESVSYCDRSEPFSKHGYNSDRK